MPPAVPLPQKTSDHEEQMRQAALKTSAEKPVDATAMSKGLVTPTATPTVAQTGTAAMNNFLSPQAEGLRSLSGPYDSSKGAPIVQFGRDLGHNLGVLGTGFKNILTTGTPTATPEVSPSTNPAPSTPSATASTAVLPNSPFAANHPKDEGTTANPQQVAEVLKTAPLPNGGAITTRLPGGGSVTNYAAGAHPSDAQVAGIPFRDAIPYGQQKTSPSTGMGVGKINGIDSDVANQQQAAAMKARGILNPGSDAYAINDQINQAIKTGKSFNGLMTQYDSASNRAAIPGADPNIVQNTDGTTTNIAIRNEQPKTGVQSLFGLPADSIPTTYTNSASAPITSTMQKLMNTPTNTPDEAREQARQILAERTRLENANPELQKEKEFNAGSADRYAKFKTQVDAERNLQTALGQGPSSDPVRNALSAEAIKNSALEMSKATGKPAESFLPKQDPTYPNEMVSMAKEQLRSPEMTQPEKIYNAMATMPGNGRTLNELETRGEKIGQGQANVEARGDRSAYQEARLKDQEERYKWFQDNKVPTQVQLQIKHFDTQANQLQSTLDRMAASGNPLTGPDSEAYKRLENKLNSINTKAWDYQKSKGLVGEDEANPYAIDNPQQQPVSSNVSQEDYSKIPQGGTYVYNGKTYTKK